MFSEGHVFSEQNEHLGEKQISCQEEYIKEKVYFYMHTGDVLCLCVNIIQLHQTLTESG